MSDQNIYIRKLEQLIANTLLPVYEKHCLENKIDIYNSGIPVQLLAKVKQRNNLPALFKPKRGVSV